MADTDFDRHNMEVDPYKRIAKFYDKLFGPLNSGLRGIGMKMYPPREGMSVLAHKGLPGLISVHGLSVDQEKIVSGGTMALFLLRKKLLDTQ